MKTLFIGNFGTAINNKSGQTDRTNAVYAALQEINHQQIEALELGIAKTPSSIIKFIVKLIYLISWSERIVVVSARNGITLFIQLFSFLRIQNKAIIVPTGGWFNPDDYSIKALKSFKGIMIQSEEHYQKINYALPKNTHHLPNFRKIYNKYYLLRPTSKKINQPIKLVFNSRVVRSKGIYELIEAVKSINLDSNKVLLDIYGQITDIELLKLNKELSDQVKYLGQYEPENVGLILNKYDILVLPTYYIGEGQPGVLLDALFNGLPIIATNWKYNGELVRNGYNGFLTRPKSKTDLRDCILKYIKEPNLIIKHSLNSKKLAKDFLFEKNIKKLKKIL